MPDQPSTRSNWSICERLLPHQLYTIGIGLSAPHRTGMQPVCYQATTLFLLRRHFRHCCSRKCASAWRQVISNPEDRYLCFRWIRRDCRVLARPTRRGQHQEKLPLGGSLALSERNFAPGRKLSGAARLFSPARNYRIAGKIPAPDADPPPDSHRGPRGRDRDSTAPILSATTHRAVSWDRGALPFQIPSSLRSPSEALADARENKSTPAHPPPRSRTGQKPLSDAVVSRHRGCAPVPERPLCRRRRHRRHCKYRLRSLPDQYPSDPDARTAG